MLGRLCAAVRYLLVLMVLPLAVVLYSSNSASASSYGPAVPFSFSDDAGLGSTWSCNGTAGYVVESSLTMSVAVMVKCGIDIQFANDPDAGDLAGTMTVGLDGARPTGDVEGCDSSNISTGDPVAGVTMSVGGFAPDCTLSNICVLYDYQDTNRFMFDEHYSGEWCGSIAMGDPPGVTDSCPLGSPQRILREVFDGTSTGWAGYYAHRLDVTFAVGADATQSTLNNGGGWGVETYSLAPNTNIPSGTMHSARMDGSSGDQWVGATWKNNRGIGSYNIHTNPTPPGGVWIYRFAGNGSPSARPHNTYQLGDNDPGNCHFYFGPKFREDPNSTLDEPSGPLDSMDQPVAPGGGSTTPPDMTPEPLDPAAPDCNFDISDPGSWLSAGMCAAVGILKAIWDVLGDVLGAIRGLISGIVNGILGLFWPDGGLELRQRVNRMGDAFEGRFPFSIPGDVKGMGSATQGTDGRITPTSSAGAGGSWGSNSCPDWTITIGDEAPKNVVCDSSFTAAIRGARAVILGALLLLAFWPLVRSVFYASFPVIKPSPSNTSEK